MRRQVLLLVGVIFFLLLLLPARRSFAHGEDSSSGHTQTLEQLLTELLRQQQVDKISQLDCRRITQDEFVEIGEAWMSAQHPNPLVHTMMDRMMGGEGSATLRNAHLQMGKNFLRCLDDRESKEGGEQSTMMNWGYGMMGGSIFGSLFLFFWLITWVLIIILLIAAIRYLWQKGNPKR